jgi:hypothetical protein
MLLDFFYKKEKLFHSFVKLVGIIIKILITKEILG